MEHTKGPWNVFDGPNGNLWIGPEEFFSIAEVRNGASDREYGGKKAERANAKLIAASPELLKACKYVKEFNEPHPLGGIIISQNAFSLILKAIAFKISVMAGSARS